MPKLEPAIEFTANESKVLIHKCPAEVCIDGTNYVGDGEVYFETLPKANIYIYGYFPNVSLPNTISAAFIPTTVSNFKINGREIKGLALSCKGNAAKITIKWSPKSEPINGVGAESTQLTRVVFHLFNFVNFIGTLNSEISEVDLVSEEWMIELKSLPSTKETIEDLKEKGGYQLTHIGGIKKVDGTPFSGKDADNCLEALGLFLCFSKGGWCQPICAVGFDVSENRVWESWSSPIDPWHTILSWFDPKHGCQLSQLFPGFSKRLANKDWNETLQEVIYWYLLANNSSRGIDAGIILTQAAIERLSYEYTVKDRSLITAEGFRNLWASDKYRLLFSSLNIPLPITPQTPELQKLACKDQMNWLDAPQALTQIRNSLIHPEDKKRGKFDAAFYEAWNLGLWYLEMSLFAICGYSGTYGNRLNKRFVGHVEDVPWK